MIRDLRADEIEARVQSVTDNGCVLLLYKNARCDMNILDETFGSMNWQRWHTFLEGKNYCTVSVWDGTKWISKQDVGTESDTEAEKGQASDAFKRACFNWGIGRELYTAPFIFVGANNCTIKEKNGKKQCYDKFEVTSIAIKDKTIIGLTIVNAKTRKPVYIFGRVVNPAEPNFSAMDNPIEDEQTLRFLMKVQEIVSSQNGDISKTENFVMSKYNKHLNELNAKEQIEVITFLTERAKANENKGQTA